MPTFKQWIFPYVSTGGETYEIRINKNSFDYTQPVATDSITLDHFKYLLDEGMDLAQEVNDEESILVADAFDIVIQDVTAYSGVSDGSPVSENLEPSQLSLTDKIFDDDTVLYTLFVSQLMPDDSWKLIFEGDLDPKTITRQHTGTIHAHTVNAQRKQQASLSFNMAADRLRAKTVQDLVGVLNDATDYGDTVKKPCYGGFISKRKLALEFDNGAVLDARTNPTATEIFEVASYGVGEAYGQRFIKLGELVTQICDLVSIEFNVADAENLFDIYFQTWNSTNDAYDVTKVAAADVFDQIYLNVNFLFGISPLDSAESFTSPVTFGRDEELLAILSAIAKQLGLFIRYEYNDTTKKPVLKLISRGTTSGTIPTNWVLAPGSKENERWISKTNVKLKFRGDSGELICGDPNGDSWDIEIPWRVRPWGGSTTCLGRELIHGGENKEGGEDDLWHVVEGGELNPSGWLGGSYLYIRRSSTTNAHYPSTWDSSNSPNTDWSGYYACTHLRFNEGATPATDVHPFATLARYYYHHLLGHRVVLEREYIGIADDSGDISGVSVLFTFTENIRGADRTFKAIKLKRSLRSFRTTVTYVEVLDSSVWTSLPVSLGGEASQSTNGMSGNTVSNDGTDTGYLLQKPTVTFDNTATAQTATTVPLTAKAHASQSVNLIQALDSSDVELAGVKYNGISFAKAFACNVTSSAVNYQILPTDGCLIGTATITATLIASPIEGQCVTVSNQGAGVVTVARSGSQTINGVATSRTIAAGFAEVYRYDGVSNWVIEATYAGASTGGSPYFDDPGTSPATAPSATGTHAVAIGNDAVSSGTKSVAIGTTRASGTESISFAGSDATTTYGAQGANSIAGGVKAKAVADRSAVVGGDTNTVLTGRSNSGVFAGSSNSVGGTVGSDSVILGGNANTFTTSGAQWGVIAGGQSNNISSGGWHGIFSGLSNSVSNSYSVTLGGQSNVVSGTHSATLGGQGLSTSTNFQVLAGQYNVIESTSFAIGCGIGSTTANRATAMKLVSGNLIIGGQVTGGHAGVTGSITVKLTGETVGATLVPLTHAAARTISIPDYSADTHLVHAPAGTNGDYLQWTSGKPTWGASTLSLTGAIIIDPASDTRNVIQPTAGTVKALVIKNHASQTDNTTEWQTSAGAAESWVDSNRRFNSSVDVMFDNGNETNVFNLNASNRVWATQGDAGAMPMVVTAHPTPSTDIVHVETDGGADVFTIGQDYTTYIGKKFVAQEQTINTPFVVALGGANVANASIGNATLCELTSTANIQLQSIAGGANGRIIRLVNVAAFTITLVDNDIPSVAINRFMIPSGNLALNQYEGATFVYTTTNQRWCRIG